MEQSAGLDWRWGIWEDAAGTPLRVEFFGNAMRPADVLDLINGSTHYSLNGIGPAAALLSHDNRSRLLQGSATVHVGIGAGSPSVSASLGLSNPGGDYLLFDVSATLQNNGTFSYAPTYYQLNADGHFYSTFTDGGVNGYLVGTTPLGLPSGIVGQFNFLHGSEASVQGGFGANLAP